MKININTINDYLESKSLNEWSNQWIFHSIVDEQYLIEAVSEDKKAIIQRAAELLKNEISNFKPYNKDIWNVIFPHWENTISNSTVYFVVGCPNPYDAMTRTSPDGEEVTIFDINRMLNYVDSIEKLLPVIKNLLTHEYCHICLHSDYPTPKDTSTFLNKLQYICFDEGFTHLLSFNENIIEVNWLDNDRMQKKKNAYQMLKYAVNSNDNEHTKLLEKANSGVFWDKFGAISGFFAIADIFCQSNYDYNKILEIYQRGPEKLLLNILGKVNQ